MTRRPASARRRAATRPSPPLLPGPHRIDDRSAPPPSEVDREGPDRGGDGRAGVLHEALLGDAQRLGPPVRAGHRLGGDRREGGRAAQRCRSPRRSSSKSVGSFGRQRRRRFDGGGHRAAKRSRTAVSVIRRRARRGSPVRPTASSSTIPSAARRVEGQVERRPRRACRAVRRRSSTHPRARRAVGRGSGLGASGWS